MSRRTRGLCRRTPTVTAWHGGSAERSTSSRVRIVAELATTHHAVPAPRKRTTKSRCSRERAADGPEAGQLSSEGRSAWTRRILEAAAVIRSVHTADRADVVGQQQAWSNPDGARAKSELAEHRTRHVFTGLLHPLASRVRNQRLLKVTFRLPNLDPLSFCGKSFCRALVSKRGRQAP